VKTIPSPVAVEHEWSRLTIPVDPDWTISLPGFSPAAERATETLLTAGNGFAGVRGSLEEGSSWSHPGTFLAGVFDHLRMSSDPPEGLRETPALVVLPDWLSLSVQIDGIPLALTDGDIVEHERLLHLRDGLIIRRWQHRLPSSDRIVQVVTRRAALQSDRHAFVQQILLTAENFDAQVQLDTRLDTRSASGLVFEPPTAVDADEDLLVAHTRRREFTIAIAERCRLSGAAVAGARSDSSSSSISRAWAWRAQRGCRYEFERRLVCFTSKSGGRPAQRAVEHVRALEHRSTEMLVEEHRAAWAERWRDADVRVEGDPRLQRALRFAA
jgi:trehalose/maltose hydrolase-like predicted phosphorylase